MTLIMLIVSTVAGAQSMPADPSRKNITPPTPDAWQFMKYGENPVSRETGVPNISIPIHTITSGELSVPISISYHAGGIRVDDIASWVGLGWTLNAGGMVSRVTKGLADECGNGLLFLPEMYSCFDENRALDFSRTDIGLTTNYDLAMNMRSRQIDSEPDVFNFNFGGTTGKFFIDPKSRVVVNSTTYTFKGVTQPKSDFDILLTVKDLSSTDRRITKVVITTPEGIKYSCDVVATFSESPRVVNVTWYLTQIQSANNTESITFVYKDFGQRYHDYYKIESSYKTFTYPNFVPSPVTTEASYMNGPSSYTEVKLPDRIEFATGKVVFNSVDDRQDDYVRRLESIDVFSNTQALPIRSFRLANRSYFQSGGSGTQSKRLKLDSLIEQFTTATGSKVNPPYVFSYHETGNNQLPVRHSTAQDYWGYYNGKTLNPSLLPLIDLGVVQNDPAFTAFPSVGESFVELLYFNPNHNTVGNANRETDSTYMRAGTISEIRYPTGGTTRYTFESNTVKYEYIKQNTNYTDSSKTAAVYPGNTNRDNILYFTSTGNYIARVEYHIVDTGLPAGTTCPVGSSNALIQMDDLSGTVGGPLIVRQWQSIDGELYVMLREGVRYRLRATSNCNNIVSTISVSFQKPPAVLTQQVVENRVIGGLRVARIRNYDHDGRLISEKKFDYTNYTYSPGSTPAHVSTGYSSGSYNGKSLPEPKSFMSYSIRYFDGPPLASMAFDYTYGSSAFPTAMLGFSAGDGVTYECVTETVTGVNEGKTIYRHDTFQDELFVGYNNVFPLDRSWLRGQPRSEFYYNATGQIVKEVQYAYEVVEFPATVIRGVRIDKYVEVTDGVVGACIPHNQCLCCTAEKIYEMRKGQNRVQSYTVPFQWKRLVSQTVIMDGVTSTTAFEYNAKNEHTNVVAVRKTDSRGHSERVAIRYAHETNNATLKTKNMIGIPLESDAMVDGVFTSGTRLTYGCPGGCGLVLPIKFEQRLDNSTYRTTAEIVAVNTAGRFEEIKTGDGLVSVYKWDASNEYPMMRATAATAAQVAFTSFETAESEGGWTFQLTCTSPTPCISACPDQYTDPYGYAQCYNTCMNTYNQCLMSDAASQADSRTGNRSFIGTGSITKTVPLGNYKLSFWAKKTGSSNGSVSVTGGGIQSITTATWAYYEFTANAATSISIGSLANARIDDVMLSPVSSQTTVFTVKPLVGVTTVTDPNHTITYYEYDTQNRLKLIRDDKNNILQRNLYNYKNQQP